MRWVALVAVVVIGVFLALFVRPREEPLPEAVRPEPRPVREPEPEPEPEPDPLPLLEMTRRRVGGLVVDGSGTPVFEATVALRREGHAWQSLRETTNLDGRFVTGDLDLHEYEVRADKEGLGVGSVFTYRGDGSLHIVLRAPKAVEEPIRTSILPLELRDASGSVLAGVEVGTDGDTTDEQGRVTLVFQKPPETLVAVTARDDRLGTDRVRALRTVAAKSEELVQIRYPELVRVRFEVRFAGSDTQVLNRAWLEVRGYGLRNVADWGVSEFESSCEVSLDLAHDNELLRFEVGAAGWATRGEQRWRPPRDGEPVDVVLEQAATVSGRLVSAVERPAPDAVVLLGDHSQRADARGRFEFWALTEGRYELLAHTQSGWLKQTVRLFPGERLDLGDLFLKPAVEVRGSVEDAQGKPVGGALIEASVARATSGPDGTFAILIHTPDGEPLRVRKRGYAGAVVSASPKRPTRIVLHPEGRLRLESGNAGFESLRFLAPADVEAPHRREGPLVVGLPPGPVKIHLVDYTGRVVVTHEAESVAGETRSVRLP